MNPIELYNALSSGPESRTFELLKGQLTIMAIGMADGDYITFEVLQVSEGLRAKICGCFITADQMAQIAGVQELQCPGCNDNFQRPVRLTPQNPVVILDYPQDTLLRAVYHGTGLGEGTVTAWVTQTHTPYLTDTLRGCPPLYYAADEIVWIDTGAIRCLVDGETVEIEQVNQCGERQWVEAPYDQNWVDTGQIRCLPDDVTVENEQSNRCGDRRWVQSAQIQDWVDTVNTRCVSDLIQQEQMNQCGQRRWVETGAACDDGEVEPPPAPSVHSIVSLTAAPPSAVEGAQFCWTIVLNAPVTGAPLVLTSTLSGTEQTAHGYVAPTAVFDIGDAVAQMCVTTTNDVSDDGNTALCLQLNGNARLLGVPGAVCVDVLDNDAAPNSIHTITSIVPVDPDITEGDTAQWTVTLNGPVSGAALTINFGLSGTEQAIHAYTAPSLVIPIGASSGVASRVTTDDTTDEPTRTLALTALTSARVTSVPAASSINVEDNDEPIPEDSVHTVISVVPSPTSANEGSVFNWTVTLNSPVVNSPLLIVGVLTGAEQAIHGYAGPSVSIPVGQTSGILSVATINDTTDESHHQLCLTVQTGGRITSVPAAACVTVLDNDSTPPSVHTITSITPVDSEITEGDTAQWNVALNGPVTVSALTINFNLGGTEQAVHGYAAPSLVLPIGSTGGTVSRITTDDVVDEPTRTLTLTAQTSSRVTSVPAASSINVLDNDDPIPEDSVHTVLSVVGSPDDDTEGAVFSWTVTLDAPVANSPLTIFGSLSGTEQAIHGYAAPSVVIPIGNDTGILSVTTTDDATQEPTRDLCLTVQTSARVTSVPAADCVQVFDNDAPEPASLPASFGGLCFIDSPSTALSEYYLQFLANGTVRSKTTFGIGYSTSTWMPVGADPSDYEVRIDDTSDLALTRDGPTRGAWHNLGVTQDFRWQATGPGVDSGTVSGAVRVRRVGESGDDDVATLDPATFVGVNTDCP